MPFAGQIHLLGFLNELKHLQLSRAKGELAS